MSNQREILFRGKRKDGGGWREGYYAKIGDLDIIIGLDGQYHGVIPETVGEYTGLTDNNGTRIYEGDIIEYQGKRYYIDYLTHYARFSAVKPNTVFCVFAYQRGEVIGNVHDNPELLEVTANA